MRTRLSAVTAVLVAGALVVGTAAVAVVFARGRIVDLDQQTEAESDVIAELVQTGSLPRTLPVNAGSSLLAQVLDSSGAVLAATPSASPVQSLVQSHDGPGVHVLTDEDGSYVGAALRVRVDVVGAGDGRRYIVVAAPLADVRRELHSLKLVLELVVPVLVLLATALIWLMTGLALRPVESLRQAADRLFRDRGTGRLPARDGHDELARLGQTLNTLLDSLHAAVAQQKTFVADAAHELRSPLASMRVQLEVATLHPRSSDVPLLLHDLLEDVIRLGSVTEDLLDLARHDTGHGLPMEGLDLRTLIVSGGPPVIVMGHEGSLRRVLRNLEDNARRHATQVETTLSVEGEDAVIDVDDDGPGIAEADRERVFDRWVRLDEARDRPSGGSGLGLALVREITTFHGGSVEVASSPLGGARLRVRLPLASSLVVSMPHARL